MNTLKVGLVCGSFAMLLGGCVFPGYDSDRAEGCIIDGVLRVTDEPHPTEPCKICEPGKDPHGWTRRTDGNCGGGPGDEGGTGGTT